MQSLNSSVSEHNDQDVSFQFHLVEMNLWFVQIQLEEMDCHANSVQALQPKQESEIMLVSIVWDAAHLWK